MIINVIIPSFYPAVIYGGPIFSTLNTCKELSKLDNIKINVSTTNTNMYSKLDVLTNKYLIFGDNLNVKYYNETIIGKFSFSLILNIWKDIKLSDITHIQSLFNIQTPVSLFYSWLYKKPIVLSPRGSLGLWVLGQGSRFKKLWLKLFILPFSNYVVWHATAIQEKKEILNFFPKAKVEIIPNGIYTDEFKKINKIKYKDYIKKNITLNIKNTDKIIVSMGRLQKKKGFDILIDSFKEVLKIYPNSYLFIAGPDQGEQINLENQIKSLKLEGRVYLVGSIENQKKIDFLGNADMFVLPSHNENFGNVYLESLAAGTPIIASFETPWSVVEKYNCGKWIKNSIKDTSSAMIELLKEDRLMLRKNSINLARQYEWSYIAKEFRLLFNKIV
jgi:glycosyltransferase involved in cell wall biosynthesis